MKKVNIEYPKPPPDQNTISNSIEEYKELRAEIRHYLERRSNNLNFIIIITLGVVGLGFQLENYILFFSASILIWILWFDEIRRIKAINRTSSYIEVVIESKLNGLFWETLAKKNSLHKQIFGRLISNATYPFLYVLNCGSGLYTFYTKFPNLGILTYSLIIFPQALMFISLSLISYRVSKSDRDRNIKEWERILKE